MFKDLKEAIELVLGDPSEANLKALEDQYKLNFVEPEDDKEFQDWQDVCFPE